jgi:DNA-binding MarR family transcriptional regulator
VSRHDAPRRCTVLVLTPAEAELVERALERMPKRADGNGEPRMVRNVLEMLETSNYTDRELGELGELAAIGDER